MGQFAAELPQREIRMTERSLDARPGRATMPARAPEYVSNPLDQRLAMDERARLLRLVEFSSALARASSGRDVMRSTARHLPTLVRCDRASVALRAHGGGRLEVLALAGDEGTIPLGASFGLGDSMLGQVVRTRASVLIDDLEGSGLEDCKALANMGMSASLDAPLMVDGDVVGTLNTALASEDGYTDLDRFMLEECTRVVEPHLARCRVLEHLRERLSTVESDSQSRSELLSEFSHEIRTPLTSILGYAELMKDGPPLDADRREAVDAICRSGKHILEISRATLDKLERRPVPSPSRATSLRDSGEEHRIDTTKTPARASRASTDREGHDQEAQILRLATIFDDLQRMLGPLARAHGVALDLRDAKLALQAGVDLRCLTQVLLNLVHNALKFGGRPGDSNLNRRVLVQARAGSPIESTSEAGTDLRIEVRDWGPGIAHRDLPRIFAERQQAEAGVESGQGFGLGLSIARRLTAQLGGSLHCSSRRGDGATFWLWIPRALRRPKPEATPEPERRDGRGNPANLER